MNAGILAAANVALSRGRFRIDGGFVAKVLALCVLVFFLIAPFIRWPMEDIFWKLQAGVLAIGAGLFALYLVAIVLPTLRVSRNLALVLTALTIPVLLAVTANVNFGQPLIYGLLASREWLIFCWVPLLGFALGRGWIGESHLRVALLAFAWASLGFYLTFVAVANPQDPRFEGLVSISVTRGYRFALVPTMLLFAALYYFIDLVKTRSPGSALGFVAFFGYLVAIHQSRSIIAILGLLMAWIVFRHAGLRDRALYFAVALVAVPVLAGMLALVSPESITNFALSFEHAVLALMGIESADSSANARIFESAIAVGYLLDHPLAVLTGSGRLSNQWQGGYEHFFGHFYPADIGVLGAIFSLGAVGIAVAALLPFRAFMLGKRCHLYRTNVFFQACFYFLVFKLIRSLSAGDIFFTPSELVVPIAVIFAVSGMQQQVVALGSAVLAGAGFKTPDAPQARR